MMLINDGRPRTKNSDKGPDICDHSLAFVLRTVWTFFFAQIIFGIWKWKYSIQYLNSANKITGKEMRLILEVQVASARKSFSVYSLFNVDIFIFSQCTLSLCSPQTLRLPLELIRLEDLLNFEKLVSVDL